MQIANETVVSIDYELTDDAGQVVDTSKGRGPLSYLHGVGQIIPGLEAALVGKQQGDQLKVTVPPGQAYGERDENLVQPVPRDAFKGVPEIKPGMRFTASNGQHQRLVTVVGVSDEAVTVDANHPLAGKSLNFDVTVVEVRAATAEEMQHGHAHGPGGHHH
jgi:FKBP-type peptidyl-prolyl cis-trans isomerase SlyD